MAVRITHSVVEGGTVDETAAVDGAAWDAEHVLENPEDLPISTATQEALDTKASAANAFRFVNPAGADGNNVFGGATVGNTTLSPGGGASNLASANIGIGKDVLYSLTTGYSNVGIGLSVMGLATTANFNVGIGEAALGNLTTGAANVMVGYSAGYHITTGGHNTAVGLQAFYNNTTGSNNTAFGRDSLFSNTTGNWNTSYGVDANPGNSTGSYNTVVGGESFYGDGEPDYSVNQNLTGSFNTVIGAHAGSTGGVQNRQNITVVGYGARATADNQVVLGGPNVTETLLRGNVKAPTIVVNGTAGDGYIELQSQSAGVPVPTAGLRLYADASDRLAFKNLAGVIAAFDTVTLTNHRTYSLPDAAGTVAVSASAPLVLNATTGNLTITLGTNVATFLATPSSANLRAAVTDESGTGALLFAGGAVATVKQQNFTASGTYTPSTGMLYCTIECVGGGGGGGGAGGTVGSIFAGGGGGSGGYSRLLATAATIGASKAVTIGAAGAAGTTGGTQPTNNGGAGGDTSIGSLCIGKGGGGGTAGSTAGASGAGAGGVAGTGDVVAAGNSGLPGAHCSGAVSVVLPSGQGGSSFFGGAARGVSSAGATTGQAAGNYGSGGSGGFAYSTASTAAGGAGSAGFVVITEYCSQ